MTQVAQPNTGRTFGLSAEPLDVLFFRDGRPFAPADHGRSLLPMPQTFAGAIRTHLLYAVGCEFKRLGEELDQGAKLHEAIDTVCGAGWIGRLQVRGPWLARTSGPDRDAIEVLVPAPSTLHRPKAAARLDGDAAAMLLRLDPLAPHVPLPGWRLDRPGMRPLWQRKHYRSERPAGFLTPAGLAAFLAGDVPEVGELIAPDELYAFDRRTGIGIHPDRLTAQESLIYGASFLALKPGVSLYLEVVLPPDTPDDPMASAVSLAVGGESRHVVLRPVAPCAWPGPAATGERALLLLTTPGLFASGWCPACLAGENKLVAASVPGYEPVSGWDLARGGPKPTRFAAAAGSVYFVSDWPNQPSQSSLADDLEDGRQGWGCYLTGVWNYV